MEKTSLFFTLQSESFGLYALYSKNKPKSDALILHRRHDIFKVGLYSRSAPLLSVYSTPVQIRLVVSSLHAIKVP